MRIVIICEMKEQAKPNLSQQAENTGRRANPPVIPVSALLGGHQCARLEHRGEHYLLRVTRNGKLILTK